MATPETLPKPNFVALANEHMGEGGLFVYEGAVLRERANELLNLELPYGLTVRYAAKANSHPDVIKTFDEAGLHFDASSVHEAQRLIENGVEGSKISLSSQILANNYRLDQLIEQGVQPVATSLRQVKMLGELGMSEFAIRVNPGIGSGHNNRTNVGGPASSFGIWHEQLDAAKQLAFTSKINRLHTHIGSGADPAIWRTAIQKSLGVAEQLPNVTTLDIGGGYKTARMPGEKSTDMQQVAQVFSEELELFAGRTGRQLRLEIEPGTYLVANAGTLLGRVEELVDTPDYNFMKLNVGMNALMRPSLYGSQHPIEVINDSKETNDFVVVGPCCESGDILTPAPDDPEGILPRRLKQPHHGDIVAIGGAGAYGFTMAANRYNDIPPATELFVN